MAKKGKLFRRRSLEFGLSLDETGVVLGLSKSWTLRLRKRFGRLQTGEEKPKTKRGLRHPARMTFEAEAALLEPPIELAKQGGVVIVQPLKIQIETVLGIPWRCQRCTRCCTATVGVS